MTQTINATYDGHVFRPNQPIDLEANTQVKITIDEKTVSKKEKLSFLQISESMSFDGPRDLSANIDKYLYENSDKENGCYNIFRRFSCKKKDARASY